MNRREFIRDFLLWSAGLTLSIPRLTISEASATPPPPLLAVEKGTDHVKLVQQVLASLGDMKNFVHPGDRVVVKPNIGWDRSPEQAANTNPVVVKELVKQVLEAGASRVLIFDRT